MAQGIRDPLFFGIPHRFKWARKRLKLGPTAVARRAGLSPETGSNIEGKGTIPRVDAIEALARVLNVEPGWLAFAKPREEPSDPTGLPSEPLHGRLGERLRQRREAAGISVRALAAAASCSDTAVRNIENGQVAAGVNTVEALADALGISPRWLAYGEGPDPTE